MANFVETATLKLLDQTSKQAKTMEGSIRALYKEAAKLQKLNKPINLRFNNAGLSQSKGQLHDIYSMVNSLARQNVALKINNASLKNTETQLDRLIKKTRELRGAGSRINIATTNPNQPRNNPMYRPPSSYSLNVNPLQVWSVHFLARLGTTIESSFARATSQGFRDNAVAENRMNELQLTDDQKKSVRKNSIDLAQQNPVLNPNQYTNLISDIYPTTRGNLDQAQMLAKLTSDQIARQVRAGVEPREAYEKAINLVKGLDSTGLLTDANGNVDVKKAEPWFNTASQIFAETGADFGSSDFRQMIKYLRSSRFAMTQESMIATALMNEESGSTASVGINQLVKQMSGNGLKKKNRAILEEMGLLSPESIMVGKVGNKTIMEEVGGDAVNESELRLNTLAWVGNNVIPAMIKNGYDPNDPVSVSKFAMKAVGDRTGQEALATLILKQQELQKQVANAMTRNYGQEYQDFANSQSPLFAMEAAKAQFEGTMGAITSSFNDLLIPAVNGAGNAFLGLTSWINGGGDDGNGSKTKSAAVVAGAGLTAYGGYKALQKFTGFGELKLASLNLNTAASNLNAAAAKLAMGGKGNGGVIVGGDGKTKPTSKTGKYINRGIKGAGYGYLIYMGYDLLTDALHSGGESQTSNPQIINEYTNPTIKDEIPKPYVGGFWEEAGNIVGNTAASAFSGGVVGSGVPVLGTTSGALIGGVYGASTSGYNLLDRLFPQSKIPMDYNYYNGDNSTDINKIATELYMRDMALWRRKYPYREQYALQGVERPYAPQKNEYFDQAKEIREIIASHGATIDNYDFNNVDSLFLEVDQRRKEIGDGIAEAILALSQTIGTTIGQAMSRNFNPGIISVEATVPQQTTDTGANNNNSR